MNKAEYKIELFTGVRASGDLTVANYLGAVEPIVKLQDQGVRPVVFVADLHAMTDKEPSLAKKFIREVVADYIALGLDPEKAVIFVQSEIGPQVFALTGYLSRLVTVAELLRIPTLKEKLKYNADPETANALLLLYPVLMAADILIQRAKEVPIGEDQMAHMEMIRELARRFNKRYGEVLPVPKAQQVKTLRILSLKGDGKMSKSSPEGAIFLTDKPEEAAKKIKRAETAFEGKMSDILESHIILAKGLDIKGKRVDEIDNVIKAHLAGEKVMGKFKDILAGIVGKFLEEFQLKRKKITEDKDFIDSILKKGAKFAKDNANETLSLVEKAMFDE